MTPTTARTPFDPLALDNLQVTFVRQLLGHSFEPFPPPTPFPGAGVYGLYYIGSNPLYAALAASRRLSPIYVGQSARPNRPVSPALCQRISKHAGSVGASSNLSLSDFRCRALVLVPAWIEFAEHLLIEYFQPVWNKALTGLGSNPTGGRRSGQQVSRWDALHGGRAGAGTGSASWTRKELTKMVQDHLAAHPPLNRKP